MQKFCIGIVLAQTLFIGIVVFAASEKKLEVTTIGRQVEVSEESHLSKRLREESQKKEVKNKSSFFKKFFDSFKPKKENPQDELGDHLKERMRMVEEKIKAKKEERKLAVAANLIVSDNNQVLGSKSNLTTIEPKTSETGQVKKEMSQTKVDTPEDISVTLSTNVTQGQEVHNGNHQSSVSGNSHSDKSNTEVLKTDHVQKTMSSNTLSDKPIKKGSIVGNIQEVSSTNVHSKVTSDVNDNVVMVGVSGNVESEKIIVSSNIQSTPSVEQGSGHIKIGSSSNINSEKEGGEVSGSDNLLSGNVQNPTPVEDVHPVLSIIRSAALKAPEILGSMSNYNISKYEEQIQKASDRHTISLISSWNTEQDRSPNNVDGLTEGRIGLRFQKNLWDPPASSRISAAIHNAKEKKALLEVQKQIFVERTCRLYLNLFRMENTLELAKLNRGVNFDNFIATNDRYFEGELTKTDKELASTRFNVSKAVLVDAEYQQKLTKSEFEKITGVEVPEELIFFDIDSNHPLMQEIISGNQQVMYYPEQAAIAALESQQKLYEVSKFNQWPILSLSAESAFLEETGSLATRVDWEHSIGINFTIPLYNGGGLRFDREREWARVKVMESQLEITRREKKSEVERILATLEYNQDLKKYYEKAEASADEMVKGFREEYKVGTRTSTDLLDAENERFTVKVRRLNSELDLTLAKISLLRVFGLLDNDTLSRLIIKVEGASIE